MVSDWGSIGELINYGFTQNGEHAAQLSINAGSDMDMESRYYRNNLSKLVAEGKVYVKLVDDALKRVLFEKFELGLFDDPYKFCDEKRHQKSQNNLGHRKVAREVGAKSTVLLKNENNLLPLSIDTKNFPYWSNCN